MAMLDHLRIAIPVFKTHVNTLGSTHVFNGDLLDCGLPCASRHISRGFENEILTGDLYHPYESLPSSYTDMAFKFFTQTTNCLPHVELKASPLKLLQGHNVYGFDDIELGAVEMLGLLGDAYPQLCGYLNFAEAQVYHLDTTAFARLPHQGMVQPVLDFLSSVSTGHRKAKQVKYSNYITWGSENSRRIRPKAYGKFEELKSQIQALQKRADKGCHRSKLLVEKSHDVLPFSNAMIRFEGRVCRMHMVDNKIPTNLWELIKYQKANPTLLDDLWHVVFDPILTTLKGKDMTYANDNEILDLLKDRLKTTTKTGRISYTKANNAFRFYSMLRQMGFENVKTVFAESTFYDNLNNLLRAGISKAHLQNVHKSKKGAVIPFVRVVEIDFKNQLPPNYVKPHSHYLDLIKVA